MLVVSLIRVRSLSTDYAHITWQVEPTPEDISDYDFYVLRSGGQAGPYNVISPAVVDTFIFRDNTAKDKNLWGDYYYRIRVVRRVDSEEQEYGSRTPEEIAEGKDPGGVSKDPEPSKIATEIIYRKRVELKAYTGRDFIAFQRRRFGQRCVCFDSIKKERKKSHCKLCYGSGFAGGFHTPILFKMGQASQKVITHLRHEQALEAGVKVFSFDNYPELRPRDVLVESDNTRWRVANIDTSRVQGTLVSQRPICSRIPKTDVEYDLPIRGIDPVRWVMTDERHYIGAPNVESMMVGRNKLEPLEI